MILVVLSIGNVLGQECNIIYVTPNGSGSGTKAGPTNILTALTIVAPGVDHIRMASGTYNISSAIDLISGVTIEGGFNSTTWEKSNNTPTLIYRDNSNTLPAPERIIALSAININNFGLHDISVEVQDAAGAGVTTYGVYINGCSDYTLSRVRSRAGNGSSGIDGVPGVDGVDGADGEVGQDGNGCGDGNYAGGAGGNSWGGGIAAGGNGGNGGPEGTAPDLWPPWDIDWGEGFDGQPGQPGTGAGFGAGGPGGPGYENATPSRCTYYVLGLPITIGSCSGGVMNNGQWGQDATDGADGLDGTDGIPANVGGYFIPGDGVDGDDGEHGSGGGGGGGAGSHGGALFGSNSSAAGGGGGGEGGEAGTGATAGTGGGGSFGAYITNNGTGGYLHDCVFNSGLPGYGGIGGYPGGLGGQGGIGGWGGADCNLGGQGGNGSAAGDGGNGGNGAPGISQPLFQEPTGIQTVQTSLAANVEPNIILNSTGCTFSDIYYTTNANGIIEWFYEGSTVPQNTVGQSTIAQYTNMGALDLTMVANGVPYFLSEFVNIFIDGSPYLPTIQADDTICPGDVVNFSSTWPISFNVLGYRWDFGDPGSPGNSSSQATPSHTYNNVGTYMVTLQTESPCCGWSKPDTHFVTVMPIVTPDVFITATTTEICEGESITFGAVPYAGGSSPDYEWFHNGVSSGTDQSYTPFVINNGDQVYVQMASSYPCPITPNVSSETVTVIVHPNPVIDCSSVTDSYLGAETGFDAQMSVGTAPFEFLWQFGDGGSSDQQSPSHLYGGTGVYNVNVEVTDTFGCSSICDVAVDIVLPPYVYAGFTYEVVQECGSTTVVFTDTTFGNPTSWEWDFGDGAMSDQQNPSHTFNGVGPYTITLSASNGVFTDTLVVPNIIEMLVVPSANFFVLDDEVCDSIEVRFYDESVDAATWEWNFGDVASGSESNVSSLQNPYHAYNDPGVFTVSLTVYSVDDCPATASTLDITVHESPIAGFWGDTLVCTDVIVLLNDTSKEDINIDNWYYHFGDKNELVEFYNKDVFEYTFEEPGWYIVEQFVTNQYGCSDSLERVYEVVPHPTAGFYPDSVVLVLPDTTMEFWNTSYDVVHDSSHWDFGNGYTVDNQYDAVGIFPDSGLFNVQLIVDNHVGCPDTIVIPYRVWEQETFFIQSAFTPNGDGINDKFEIKQKGIIEWHLQIYDRWGKLAWETYDVNEYWDGTHRESGKEVQEGAYTYSIDLTWYTGKVFSKLGTITIFR